MKKIKLIIPIVLSVVFVATFVLLIVVHSNRRDDGKINVVCTIFPEYDWVREVIGDENENYNLSLIVKNGTDMHSYQITVQDMAKISTADLFIYVGGESDAWVSDAIKNVTNKNFRSLNLLEILGENAKEEELKEGMEEHEHEEDEGDEEEVEYDEHVWLSLKNAKLFVNEIAKTLGEIDEANKDIFLTNAENYNTKLTVLDSEYKLAADNGATKTFIFGDRFPFRYLLDDYDIDYFAAFLGCSAETEATPATITYLAGKVDELEIKVILKIDSSDGKIAKAIKDITINKDQRVLTLNSLQSTTISSGETYLSIMTSNLEVFKEALKK